MSNLFIQSIITMLLPAILIFVFIVGSSGASGGDALDHTLAFVMTLLTLAAMHYVFSDREP